MADELPRVIVQPSALTSAPSAGHRAQPLMMRSTLSSPMMTTGVAADRGRSRSGIWLEVMAIVEREVFDDAIDDVAGRRSVRPETRRQAPEQRKQLTGHHVRDRRQVVAGAGQAATLDHLILVAYHLGR